jgi:hypothetical protein
METAGDVCIIGAKLESTCYYDIIMMRNIRSNDFSFLISEGLNLNKKYFVSGFSLKQ